MTLTQADKKHWGPIPQVQDYLRARFNKLGATILDVGPGHSPLDWATDAVDFVDVEGLDRLRKCDLANEPLPFPDKSFDLVYARHIIEDMHNPFPLIQEMQRVGKAGYIECPSPICELMHGVDGGAAPWRGYHHHRFIVWVAGDNELRLVSKYPLIEYLKFVEDPMVAALRSGPKYWNSYYLWEDKIHYKHRQSPLDFDIPRDYGPMLADACAQSKAATDCFWALGISEEPETMPSLRRAFG